MRFLLTGQSGFIGSRLRERLLRLGHDVPPLRIDFRAAQTEDAWRPHLVGVDVVINTAGVFTERRAGDFAAINHIAPCALFRAAAGGSARLIIQFSALGADAQARSRFHLSKRAADECLRAQPVPSYSVQPSLVFGAAGGSAQLMTTLAGLPIVPLPGEGRQMIQPIHVDDLVEAVVALLKPPHLHERVAAAKAATGGSVAGQGNANGTGSTIALVGPRPLSLRDYLQLLREGQHLPPARFVRTPRRLMALAARVGSLFPSLPLGPEALEMLDRGNVAESTATQALLGRAPRDPSRFIAPVDAPAYRVQAALGWLLPILRISIAIMWICTAIVSVWFHPVEDSYRLLSLSGVPAPMLPLALYGAAALDLLLGVLCLFVRSRRVWQAQILLVLGYTVIIAIRLPEFLTHPFGPILKNLPILAVLWMLAELEPRRRRQAWNT